jgi:hypothetical protein
MRHWTLTILTVMLVAGCNTHNDKAGHNHDEGAGGNQALYDEVMAVHDEVMPKMNDIYKLKEQLKKEIADAPDIVEQKRREIESTIVELDAASEGMMVWMRNFNPLPDSLGEEQARKYLVEQKERVTDVREDMLQAIDKAERLSNQ